jgi:hypothetical protein
MGWSLLTAGDSDQRSRLWRVFRVLAIIPSGLLCVVYVEVLVSTNLTLS